MGRTLFPVLHLKGIHITANSYGKRKNIFAGMKPEIKRELAASIIDNAGVIAAEIAKSPDHSPVLTGRLVASIRWEPSRSKVMVGGRLSVNVPYGRVQEFSPTQPKRLYLQRALNAVKPFIEREFKKFMIEKDAFINRKFTYPIMRNNG